MSLQFATSLRNTWLDAIATAIGASAILRIATGAVPSACSTADSGTQLIAMSLPATYFAAASGGTKAKTGTWSGTLTGGASDTPGNFRFKDSGATTVFMQGTCGIGSGDMSFDGTFTSGQTVTINTFTITAPGA